MQLHGALEIFAHHVLERADLDNAGVVDQDVDLAEPIDDLANGRFNLSTIEQVALNRKRFTAPLGEIGFGAREFIGIARDENNFPALIANLPGDGQAEAAGTASDESDLIAE